MTLYDIGSVLNRFPQCDSCEFELDVVCDYNGELLYQLFDSVSGLYFEFNEHPLAYDTTSLCQILKLDELTTMAWVLRFGDTLPRHMREI